MAVLLRVRFIFQSNSEIAYERVPGSRCPRGDEAGLRRGGCPYGKGRANAAWELPSREGAGLRRAGLSSRDRADLCHTGAALAGWDGLVPHGGCPRGIGRAGAARGLPLREEQAGAA
jgi:hypothetical protein